MMKNWQKTGLGVVLLAVVLAGAYLAYGALSRRYSPQQSAADASSQPSAAALGSPEAKPTPVLAPDFTVYDAQGNAVKLSDLTGKPLVLNFWASWCGPCQSEMEHFNALYEELGGEVTFVMVNLTDGSRETVDTATQYITDQGYTFPVYFDTDNNAAATYGITSIPATLFIDSQGYATNGYIGALDEQTLRKEIEALLQNSSGK